MSDVRRIETPALLRAWSDECRRVGRSVGFVPTMGALHDGHRSLIDRARAECGSVAVSIFVNPTQFGAGEDLNRYPRPLAADLALLDDAGVDVAFVPSVEVMYPRGATTTVSVGAELTTILEGALRPGHFDGVALVVTKLLDACRPDRVYFGQKDAQQCAVVRRLIDDLEIGVELVICPVVRAGDGLALSSRNVYLSPAARQAALAIPAGLAAAARVFAAGEHDAARLIAAFRAEAAQSPDLAIDYVAVVDPETFQPVLRAAVKSQIVVAAKISGSHLIDVLRLGLDEAPPSGGASNRVEGETSDVAGV